MGDDACASRISRRVRDSNLYLNCIAIGVFIYPLARNIHFCTITTTWILDDYLTGTKKESEAKKLSRRDGDGDGDRDRDSNRA